VLNKKRGEMGEMEFAILNGEIVERSEAKVDIEDRGHQFGDGVYEVIRVYNGVMFTVDEHLARFNKSLHSISITCPFTTSQLKVMLKELVEKNKLQNGIVYMQMTRGTSPRNHAFPPMEVTPNFTAYTKVVERPVDSLKSGVSTILTDDIRWLRCDIKSLNLLGNLLAKQKAAMEGCFEAIQHRGQDVTEGSTSNVFIVKDGVVLTHESNHLILKGITKDVVLNVCAANKLPVEERTFTLEELEQADEAFLTSTTAEVMPIIKINDKYVNDGLPGPVTRKLQEWFEKEIVKQCGPLKEKLLS
jgi:D-alanine transaminase